MSIQLNEHQHLLIISILIGILTNSIALRLGFYKRPVEQTEVSEPSIQFSNVIGIFSLFLIMQVLIVPLVAFFVYSFQEGRLITSDLTPYISTYAHGWFNMLSILAGFGGVLFGLRYLSWGKIEHIFGNPPLIWKNLCFGSLAWFVCFPLVIAAGEIGWLGVYHSIGLDVHLEQLAVKHLYEVSSYPVLFLFTIIAVVFLAPLVEEILFRGLLQSWLVQKVGVPAGIMTSSLVFSLFHFASSQGLANIILVASLFVLSCFLGFVYIRQRSLWASIGLHMTFNAISVIILVFK